MIYKVSRKEVVTDQTIKLPASKSLCNRALILNALSYSPFDIENLSDSDDSVVLHNIINSSTNKFNVGHAGTAMRFLTAFLCKIFGEWELTGSARMQERPIAVLVDALRELGAEIEYANSEGYPPLKIKGVALKGGEIELDGSISSQYISALLMIAPTIEDGLTIKLKNRVTSKSYIEQTLKLMKRYGIESQFSGDVIKISQQEFIPSPYSVESDWSAASYIYTIAALTEGSQITLPWLNSISLQGDSKIAEWFKLFGVETEDIPNGVKITHKRCELPLKLELDFINTPDVAQTFVVLAILKGVPFHFSGLETLKIKETDRITALINESAKLGATVTEPKHGELAWSGEFSSRDLDADITIETYKDHRMAMAFAPASEFYSNLKIAEPMVVTKSYPQFWTDLKMLGYISEEV